jgi:hypothetical protein
MLQDWNNFFGQNSKITENKGKNRKMGLHQTTKMKKNPKE